MTFIDVLQVWVEVAAVQAEMVTGPVAIREF